MANVTKAELTKMLEDCKELSNQRENEIITLKGVIDRVESEKVSLELKLNDLSDVDELRHQYQRVSSELVSAKTELSSKEVELKELSTSYNNLQVKLKTKQDDLVRVNSEYEREINTLKSEINLRNGHIRDIDSACNSLSITIKELNQELEEAKTKFKVALVLAVSVTLTFITYVVVL